MTEGATPYDLPQVDLTRPNVARMYDWFLGGSFNTPVDREFGRQVERILPPVRQLARANREFLRRAVRYFLNQGVRQFLDIGSGVPTVGNVHEIAQQNDPTSRVVYVDAEAAAVAQSEELLRGNPHATVLQADLREPAAILDHPRTRDMLDFTQPVGLLLVAVLHFVPDTDHPSDMIASYRAALPADSYLAITHITHDSANTELRRQVEDIAQAYTSRATNPLFVRDRATLAGWLAGCEMVTPGVVYLPEWQPDQPLSLPLLPEDQLGICGVGRVLARPS